MKTSSIKIKIILAITVAIFSVAAVIGVYNISQDRKQNRAFLEEKTKKVEFSYHETIKELTAFYTSRVASNINSLGVLEAFRERNHNRLYELTLPRWKSLCNENKYLSVMQFHNADGTSLLRMHQKDIYGDAIALKRAMVKHVHERKKIISGFEEGRQGLAFRVIVPVFDKKNYIGAVEFGLSTPYITEKIYSHSGYNSIFFVNQEKLGVFTKLSHFIQFGNFMAIDLQQTLMPLLKAYKNEHATPENGIIKFDNKTYAITILPIKDYENRSMGVVMFSAATLDFDNHIKQTTLISTIIALLLTIILGFFASRIYDAIAKKMEFEQKFSQSVLDAIPSPVVVTNGKEVVAANQAFLIYFSYVSIESFKRDHQCVCDYFESGDTNEYLMPTMNDEVWTKYIYDNPEIVHRAKITINAKATVFDVKLSLFEFDKISRYVVIFTDISIIQRASTIDSLTSIINRPHFNKIYEHLVTSSQNEQKPLAIIFFDIDFFKRVNDTYGHLTGDYILKHIAAIVKNRIRKDDIFARWGGEEFVILLPNTQTDEAYKIAQNLRAVIESEDFETVSNITCSFGVAMLRENESAGMLLKRVDELLYSVKSSGRNNVFKDS